MAEYGQLDKRELDRYITREEPMPLSHEQQVEELQAALEAQGSRLPPQPVVVQITDDEDNEYELCDVRTNSDGSVQIEVTRID